MSEEHQGKSICDPEVMEFSIITHVLIWVVFFPPLIKLGACIRFLSGRPDWLHVCDQGRLLSHQSCDLDEPYSMHEPT